jgi:glycosyltransferase involved in cell wall biosynthesis
MKIAIEAQRIFRKNKHGMDFVALEVIRHLQKTDFSNQYYILVAPGEDICLQNTDNMYIIEINCPTYILWEQIALPLVLKKIKPDLLHCTSNTAPIFCKTPLVLTLHDIIYLEKKQKGNRTLYQKMGWYYRRFVVPRILPKCKKIITVSNFECKRITDALNFKPGQLVAIYNGYSSHFKPIENYKEIISKYINQDKYLMFLGNTDPKKNTARTLKAYQLYTQRSGRPLPLLIADLDETYIDQTLKDNNLESIKSFLMIPGYIANSDLPAIYTGAKVFLYTSLRESFGIPILEAMACGAPIITSNTSSMPEIAGDGAILIDPFSEEEIAQKIIQLEEDKLFFDQQVNYGLERVKLFSWDMTAKSTLKIYLSVYNELKS